MYWVITLLPLLFFGGLIIFMFRGGQKGLVETTNRATESNNRLAESNNRLVEAVNRLADVIAKK